MTRHDYQGELFKNSQFLVLVNKLLSLIISGAYCFRKNIPQIQIKNVVGACSFSAASNVLSSWFQYEALKYVNYPLHVLSKSCKLIPVMLASRLIAGKVYCKREWANAATVTLGMTVFSITHNQEGNSTHYANDSTISGLLLMLCYMATDSFTSTWQHVIFEKFENLSFMVVMLGMNLCGFVFVLLSLALTNTLSESVIFILKHPQFGLHCVMLSVTSAIGQLFIYHTIKNFGAITFVLIMTVKQALSITASCIIYGHVLNSKAVLGIGIVFSALGSRVFDKLKRNTSSQIKNTHKTEAESSEIKTKSGLPRRGRPHLSTARSTGFIVN